MTYSVGIDFGTSGARAIAIDSQQCLVAQARQRYAGSLVSAGLEPEKASLLCA